MSKSEVMIRIDKFYAVIKSLKASAICSVNDDMQDENDFNKVEWITGEDEFGSAITSKTNPHSEITWTKVKAEMDKL